MPICSYCQMDSADPQTCEWCKRPLARSMTYSRASGVDWLRDGDTSDVGIMSYLIGGLSCAAFLILVGGVFFFATHQNPAPQKAVGTWNGKAKSILAQFPIPTEGNETPETTAPEQETVNSPVIQVSEPKLVPATYSLPAQTYTQAQTATARTDTVSAQIDAGPSAYIDSVTLTVDSEGRVSGSVSLANHMRDPLTEIRLFVGTETGESAMEKLSVPSVNEFSSASIGVEGVLDRDAMGGQHRFVRLSCKCGGQTVTDRYNLDDAQEEGSSQPSIVHRDAWKP